MLYSVYVFVQKSAHILVIVIIIVLLYYLQYHILLERASIAGGRSRLSFTQIIFPAWLFFIKLSSPRFEIFGFAFL